MCLRDQVWGGQNIIFTLRSFFNAGEYSIGDWLDPLLTRMNNKKNCISHLVIDRIFFLLTYSLKYARCILKVDPLKIQIFWLVEALMIKCNGYSEGQQ